jgi:N-methylhydantoinase A
MFSYKNKGARLGGNELRAAVDIGGTFTDLVGWAPSTGRLFFSKSLTTYDRLSNGVLECLSLAALDMRDLSEFVHGSTIAINTVIQRRGARTGLITTAGFGDIYQIGRGSRPDAYNLMFEKAVPLVPRDLVLEVDERLDARGNVRRALDPQSVLRAAHALKRAGIEAVAVVLLHAYRNPVHEEAIGHLLLAEMPGVYVSLSHQILREFREYERTSTTVLNAYIGPIVANYVDELDKRLSKTGFGGNFLIMQSNGGTMSAEVAVSRPVTMMESGPVAGVIASGRLGSAIGLPDVIAFDMGGTTAKASLITNGEARIVTGYHIGGHATGHPMMLPVVDIVEVGTGGGSIAWIDAGGALKVGPLSAGSAPGPVCYGKGGAEPTTTDANLVLGRLDPDNFLGGQMKLDIDAARDAIRKRIAIPLDLNVEQAALGILKIADTKMSLAVSEVSVQKGHDPRDFSLVASGGGGPLHAVSIARELTVPVVVVPELPGTFSALGMLMTDLRHDYVRTLIADLAAINPDELNRVFGEMVEEARTLLEKDGADPGRIRLIRSLDLRYLGQEYTLNAALSGTALNHENLARTRTSFDELHHAQYSHSAPAEPVEIVNLRLAAIGDRGHGLQKIGPLIDPSAHRSGKPRTVRDVVFDSGTFRCPVYDRIDAPVGETLEGPLLIEEKVSTTIVHPGDRARLLPEGPIVITIGASA